MAMSNDDIYTPRRTRSGRPSSGRAPGRGPVIDQEGREIPDASLRWQFENFRFDFGHSGASPFGNLTREQRLARLDAIAKLLDVAFILPGTQIRYGIDGIIGLVPVIGDIISTALSLWLVREARALARPGTSPPGCSATSRSRVSWVPSRLRATHSTSCFVPTCAMSAYCAAG